MFQGWGKTSDNLCDGPHSASIATNKGVLEIAWNLFSHSMWDFVVPIENIKPPILFTSTSFFISSKSDCSGDTQLINNCAIFSSNEREL